MSTYKRKRKGDAFTRFAWIPVAVVLCILPFILKVKILENPLSGYSFYDSLETKTDISLYYRSRLFIITAAVMVVIIVIRTIMEKGKIAFSKLMIPLVAYALMVVVSSIMSRYDFAFGGLIEQFEGMWVLLGYGVVAYYCYLYIRSDEDIKRLTICFGVSTLLMIIIGVSQIIGHDITETSFFVKLIAPFGSSTPGYYRSTFEKGWVYLTLFNPNYVGVYISLISPIILMMAFRMDKLIWKMAFWALYAGLIVVLLMSGSRAGLIGIAASLFMLLVVFNRALIKHWIPVVSIILIGIVAFFVMDKFSNQWISSRIKEVISFEEYNPPRLDSIDLTPDGVVFTCGDDVLRVTYSDVRDTERNLFGYKIEGYDKYGKNLEKVDLNDEQFHEMIIGENPFYGVLLAPVTITDDRLVGFQVLLDGTAWNFFRYGDTYLYYNIYGKFCEAVDTKSPTNEFLFKHASFATYRGYIWSKTLPMLKDYLIKGAGPDSFIIEFPNEDYVSRYRGGFEQTLISKPHNQYLQMWVQTGMLSVIAYLVFYIWYAVQSLVLLLKRKKYDGNAFLSVGILCGTFAYMVVQLTNDSMVVVAPFYWAFIGIGIALNEKLKAENDTKTT